MRTKADMNQRGLFDMSPDAETVEEAQNNLRAGWLDGTQCPVCTQDVKMHQRTINRDMATRLLVFYAMDKHRGVLASRLPDVVLPDGWMHGQRAFHHSPAVSTTATGDFAKLRYWHLITPPPEDGKGRVQRGWWKLTEHARRFIEDGAATQRFIYVFNRRVWRLHDAPGEGEMLTLAQAMGVEPGGLRALVAAIVAQHDPGSQPVTTRAPEASGDGSSVSVGM